MKVKTLDTKIVLNNGVMMPQFGLGTYKMTDEETTSKAVFHAIEFGYQMIDTADYYQNHTIIGKVLSNPKIKPKNIFITSKIWPENYHNVKETYERITTELGVEQVDLLLLHWPINDFSLVIKAWKALEDLYFAKKVRAIGISNFMIEHLAKLCGHWRIKPMVNQVEMHPQLPLIELTDYCEKAKIVLTSWSTMMKGKIVDIPLANKLAKKYSVSPQAIALKWAMQRGYIVIPKSSTPSRIESNAMELDKFHLTNEEIKALNDLKGARLGPDPYTFKIK